MLRNAFFPLLLVFLFLIGCSAPQPAPEPATADELLSSVSEKDHVYSMKLLSWDSDRDAVMTVQNWTDEDLEDPGWDEESTMTKRLFAQAPINSVRFYNTWRGEEEWLAMSVYLYFETEQEALHYAGHLKEAYSSLSKEELPDDPSFEIRDAMEDIPASQRMLQSSVLVRYLGQGPAVSFDREEADGDSFYVLLVSIQRDLREYASK